MVPDENKAEEEELKKKEEERKKKMKKAEEPYICELPKKRIPLSKEELHEKCKDYVRNGILQEREIKKSFEEDRLMDTLSSNLPESIKKPEPLAKRKAPPARRMESTKTEPTNTKDQKTSSTTKTDCPSQGTKLINKSNKENWNDEGDSPPYKGTWNPNFQCEDFMKLNQRRILYGCDDELQNQFDSERSPDKKMKTIPNDEKCKNLTNLSEVKNEESKNENEGTNTVEGNQITNCPKIEVKIKKKKGDIEQTSNKDELNEFKCEELIDDKSKPGNEGVDQTNEDEPNEFKCEELIADKSKQRNEGVDQTNEDEPNEFKCEELIADKSKQGNEGVDKTNEDEPNEFKCEELIADKSKQGNEGVDKTNEDEPNEFKCEELIADKSKQGNEGVDLTIKDEPKEFECCEFKPGSKNLQKSSSEGKRNEFDCDDASASDYPSMESLNRICEDVKSSSNLPMKYPSTGDIVKMCQRVSSTNAGLKSSSEKLSQSCDHDLKGTKNAKDEQTRTCYSLDGTPVVYDESADDVSEDINSEDYGNCLLNSREKDLVDTTTCSKQSTTTECYKSEKLICHRSPNPKTNAEKITRRTSSSCSAYSTATKPRSLISGSSPNPGPTDNDENKVRVDATNKLTITGKHVQFLSPAADSTKPEQKVTWKNINSNQADKEKKSRGLGLRDVYEFNIGTAPENTSKTKIDRKLGAKEVKITNVAEKPTISKPAREKSYITPAKNGNDLKSEAVLKKIEEQTIDRVEQNINYDEQTIDRDEQTIDRDEQTIDRVEQNINYDEQTIDRDEQTIDRVEQNINHDEQTIDRVEQNINHDERSIDKGVINASLGLPLPVKHCAIYSNYEISSEIDQVSDDADVLADMITADVTDSPYKSPVGYQDDSHSCPQMEPSCEESQHPEETLDEPMSPNLASLSDDNFEDVFDSNANVAAFTSPMETSVKEDLMTVRGDSSNSSSDKNSIPSYPDSTALEKSKRIDLLKSRVKKTKIVWRQLTYGLRKGEKACLIDWKKDPLIPVKENKATRVYKAYKEKNSLCFNSKLNP